MNLKFKFPCLSEAIPLSINSTYHTITDVNLISVSFRSPTNITCSSVKTYNMYPAAVSSQTTRTATWPNG